ncbi:uncharacterized protein LACBIDRAFT_297451 [Laccaria bicolor S238N-H82]|uniref:Predicted protein n=1 Tax=Laccaria bicolor (strain S238N-H82 / ATCC MYA-4686) TaxID=486041 RepID=B0DB79_LACBS|nr:uncharacterized protein LACBIDRAFT_297451 [Laccaria bicolor S238N-H82]EDR08150.1 predicted protein [Laccaria bicolor S238N-H82]|eukprot:XP_001881220.1 predicted protein [Laccaria bicolor S238N-H82]
MFFSGLELAFLHFTLHTSKDTYSCLSFSVETVAAAAAAVCELACFLMCTLLVTLACLVSDYDRMQRRNVSWPRF